jgi:hypothetical protein
MSSLSSGHTMPYNSNDRFVISKPEGRAVYEIGIAGEIAINWRDYLDATDVKHLVDANQNTMTILSCETLDQAQLIGILNMLYQWGAVLVWLERVRVG